MLSASSICHLTSACRAMHKHRRQLFVMEAIRCFQASPRSTVSCKALALVFYCSCCSVLGLRSEACF